VPENDPSSLEFALGRGFHEHSRSGRLVLELADLESPPVEPPEGIEITTWAERPDVIAGIYDVAAEATPDIPGEEDTIVEPFEDWLAHDMQGAGDRPEATFVAIAGDEVVGYAKFISPGGCRRRPTTTSRPSSAPGEGAASQER
jgi:hypothetical protein